ncbi:hypothetical protein LX15_002592 [Streptoalloteichus tenebrarius]|uniref:Uncharacterized protein n=1 Tax=Streptoalloteichus tenebrarius (strain ATCC 17920 / DSM 40477 / JCM 4838 / CBS 697.72 / NBRC 16177 / NCIMB 11028 / NRRL B-12390 / A12253. 1 / ISP 5477) TaxID=1933 RepID=A0ABT1HTQ6_STRSD|nr:hypothetical protein [Streptoalloteichus tenebrarius]MCP2258894.1 hypothetical protein [Streptoalloteichus tenebrarius]BFE99420.1 hypothetical protein GCM10020241_10960 [Streptoalloteichus tenebrarius]
MRVGRAVSDAQEAELDLARQLRRVGERHAAEPDLYHLGHTLARRCGEHVERLAPFARRYGVRAREGRTESPHLLEALRRRSGELVGHSELAGLLLLRDLRDLSLTAHEAEIAWVILAQVAQAVRDPELLQVATECQEDARTRGKWLRTRIKQAAPQVLVAG